MPIEMDCEDPRLTQEYQIFLEHPIFGRNRVFEWPQSTEIACWHCCHPFKSRPVSLPISNRHGEILLRGVFCSFSCVVTFGVQTIVNYQKGLVVQLMKEITGRLPSRLPHAPDRYRLLMFGGDLSIEEFRNHALYFDSCDPLDDTSSMTCPLVYRYRLQTLPDEAKDMGPLTRALIEACREQPQLYVGWNISRISLPWRKELFPDQEPKSRESPMLQNIPLNHKRKQSKPQKRTKKTKKAKPTEHADMH